MNNTTRKNKDSNFNKLKLSNVFSETTGNNWLSLKSRIKILKFLINNWPSDQSERESYGGHLVLLPVCLEGLTSLGASSSTKSISGKMHQKQSLLNRAEGWGAVGPLSDHSCFLWSRPTFPCSIQQMCQSCLQPMSLAYAAAFVGMHLPRLLT